jgi:hypothetical protein
MSILPAGLPQEKISWLPRTSARALLRGTWDVLSEVNRFCNKNKPRTANR